MTRKKKTYKPQGFKSGIDVYSAEEIAKRQGRAARFDIEEQKLSYEPLRDEDEGIKRERARRFGTEYQAKDQSGLKDQDILEERKDASAAVQRRPDTVHLYGVDKLNTAEVKSYFLEFGPKQVEWIDDSSCNIVFADAYSAKRAILGLGRPLQPEESSALEDEELPDINSMPFLWHKGPDFVKRDQTEVPLIFRMATVDDKKGMVPAKPPRYLWIKHPTKPGKRKADAGDPMQIQPSKRQKPSRLRRQTERARGPRGMDIDAEEEVEEVTEAMEEEAAAELEAARAHQKAEGPSGLFSAARAGILPSFLIPGEEGDAPVNLQAEPLIKNGVPEEYVQS